MKFKLFDDYESFPKTSGIYKINSEYNNLFYIGSALSLRKRIKEHRNTLVKNSSHISRLQNIYNIYGKENLTVEFLLIENSIFKLNSSEHKKLILSEENFISSLNPTLNTIKTPTSQLNNPSRSKKVYQYDLGGNFIKEWNSGREVLRELNIQIQNGLKGKNRSSGGYQWSYLKCEKLEKYQSNSGEKKKIELIDIHNQQKIKFSSIKECCEYFKGDKKTYQNLSYSLKKGKVYKNKYLIKKL